MQRIKQLVFLLVILETCLGGDDCHEWTECSEQEDCKLECASCDGGKDSENLSDPREKSNFTIYLKNECCNKINSTPLTCVTFLDVCCEKPSHEENPECVCTAYVSGKNKCTVRITGSCIRKEKTCTIKINRKDFCKIDLSEDCAETKCDENAGTMSPGTAVSTAVDNYTNISVSILPLPVNTWDTAAVVIFVVVVTLVIVIVPGVLCWYLRKRRRQSRQRIIDADGKPKLGNFENIRHSDVNPYDVPDITTAINEHVYRSLTEENVDKAPTLKSNSSFDIYSVAQDIPNDNADRKFPTAPVLEEGYSLAKQLQPTEGTGSKLGPQGAHSLAGDADPNATTDNPKYLILENEHDRTSLKKEEGKNDHYFILESEHDQLSLKEAARKNNQYFILENGEENVYAKKVLEKNSQYFVLEKEEDQCTSSGQQLETGSRLSKLSSEMDTIQPNLNQDAEYSSLDQTDFSRHDAVYTRLQ